MNKTTAVDKREKAEKRTMQEMNEQYKCYPVQVNTYEVDGRLYKVHSHFIGDKDINDVIYRYAENRAMAEMHGHASLVQQ